MKKIALMLVLAMGLQVQAQESDFFSSNDEEPQSINIGTVDDPDGDPAPIDDYVLVLGGVAVLIGAYAYRKKNQVLN